jgi:general secretion pathway protein G
MEKVKIRQEVSIRNDFSLYGVEKKTIIQRRSRFWVPIDSPCYSPCRKSSYGFTLVELIIAMAILAILMTISFPLYTNYIDKMNINQAKIDIVILESKIQAYYSENSVFPVSLAQAGLIVYRDPWGNSYQYFRIANQNTSTIRQNARKDHFLVPINSTYDLYSMGKDGQSKKALTPKVSHDDIIRANDGAYVGLASEY